jgi:hypothetical protein
LLKSAIDNLKYQKTGGDTNGRKIIKHPYFLYVLRNNISAESEDRDTLASDF